MRADRKKEHIENFLRTSHMGNTLFDDVYLEHNALPELNIDEIDLSQQFLFKTIGYPVMINAMTGGGEFAEEINGQLAEIAAKYKIPMAVGSQTIAFEKGEPAEKSFRIVRERIQEGVVIGNVGGEVTPEYARKAVEMLQADALQIHLNVAQELVMPEGDRNFKGIVNHLVKIQEAVDVPIIIKEVGYGLSAPVLKKLSALGFRYFDVAGSGGTNFIEIENLRNIDKDFSELYNWGIPTAKAVFDAGKVVKDDATIIASGGIKSSTDIVKSLVLGAKLCGISGEILSYLTHGGQEHAENHLEQLFYKLRAVMLMVGAANIKELHSIPYIVTGRLRELTQK